MDYLLIIIIITFLLLITFYQGRIFYYRNFKSFNKEIKEFLKSNNYEFIEERKPNSEDWKKSPFKKPSKFKVSIALIKINGLPVTWTDVEHKVILGKNKHRTKEIWLEIKTTYFQKPKLKFVFN